MIFLWATPKSKPTKRLSKAAKLLRLKFKLVAFIWALCFGAYYLSGGDFERGGNLGIAYTAAMLLTFMVCFWAQISKEIKI